METTVIQWKETEAVVNPSSEIRAVFERVMRIIWVTAAIACSPAVGHGAHWLFGIEPQHLGKAAIMGLGVYMVLALIVAVVLILWSWVITGSIEPSMTETNRQARDLFVRWRKSRAGHGALSINREEDL